MAYRGDVIGCTVRFDLAKNGKVPVVFSLNGRQITDEEIVMEYTPNEKSLFPYIAMGHPGIRVLAKVSVFTFFKLNTTRIVTQIYQLSEFNRRHL